MQLNLKILLIVFVLMFSVIITAQYSRADAVSINFIDGKVNFVDIDSKQIKDSLVLEKGLVKLKISPNSDLAVITNPLKKKIYLIDILNESSEWLPAISGQQGISQMAYLAAKACPPLEQEKDCHLKYALDLLIDRIPLGSRLYILSDFYDFSLEMQAQLYGVGQRYSVVALGIYDAAEQKLPPAGFLNLQWGNVESSHNNSLIDSQSAEVQTQYITEFSERQHNNQKLCEKADIYYRPISSAVDDLTRIFQVAYE